MAKHPPSALERGQQVLQVEREAIGRVAERLGEPFLEAIALILACDGRVVVTGMGKAGIVGQKLSATLASTGTPSLWIHPSEALHGDLGRIRECDLVFALSNSGRTRELLALMPALKGIGAKVVAMTASADCPLGQHADLVLEIGEQPEACPLGLAPTATTTALLALGDALAMAVLGERNFTREDFARYHPAGSLGHELMQIGDIMRQGDELPLAPKHATLRETISVMGDTPGRPGAALVVDEEGGLVGIFTDGDLRRLLQENAIHNIDQPVTAHMARSPRVATASMLVGEALKMIRQFHVDQLPVVDDGGKAIGLLDVQDLLEVQL